jgi:maltose phosphorylase
MDMAYTFYLRTSLYLMTTTKKWKKAVTSMAGTWMSIVEGFGGMRIKDDTLHFPKNSKRMERVFV